MNRLNNRFKGLYEQFMPKLIDKTPTYLSYHNAQHTQYVIDHAELIASAENLNDYQIDLLKTTSLFHDFGYLYGRYNHEEKSCEIARDVLIKNGFTVLEIDEICKMIMATKIPQTPGDLMEKIIADADLYYLGTHDFCKISEKLYLELKHFDPDLDQKKWLDIQIDFISNHQYFTDFCLTNREPIKVANLENLKKMRGANV